LQIDAGGSIEPMAFISSATTSQVRRCWKYGLSAGSSSRAVDDGHHQHRKSAVGLDIDTTDCRPGCDA